MGYLGELVSKYLIASEELVLDLIGMTDSDVSKFASTSALLSVEGNHNNKRYDNIINPSLRLLRLSGNNSLTSNSYMSFIQILNAYPMVS